MALQLIGGVQQVIYTAPASIPTSTLDVVSYFVRDQIGAVLLGGSNVMLDPGPVLTSAPPGVVGHGQKVAVGSVTPGDCRGYRNAESVECAGQWCACPQW